MSMHLDHNQEFGPDDTLKEELNESESFRPFWYTRGDIADYLSVDPDLLSDELCEKFATTLCWNTDLRDKDDDDQWSFNDCEGSMKDDMIQEVQNQVFIRFKEILTMNKADLAVLMTGNLQREREYAELLLTRIKKGA